MTWAAGDRAVMARALKLAARGMDTADPNPRVGCVILRDGTIVGEGWHERAGEPHAEIIALAAAGDNARGGTVYVSLEPCCHQGRTPPCTDALIRAGVARVVYGAGDPNPRVAGGGEAALRAAGIVVQGGLLAAEAEALNPGFVSRMTRGKPWVRSKIAASLDGRTALANGASQWLTGPEARADVQRWRARSSAILTGIGTVLADDPLLTVRQPVGARQPRRVVLDSALRMPPSARLLREPGPVLVLAAHADAGRQAKLEAAGAQVEIRPGSDLPAVLRRLGELEVNELWVEAGARLNGALLAAGCLDELVVYLAPSVLGASARGMFELAPLASLAERPMLELKEVRQVGADLRLRYMRSSH